MEHHTQEYEMETGTRSARLESSRRYFKYGLYASVFMFSGFVVSLLLAYRPILFSQNGTVLISVLSGLTTVFAVLYSGLFWQAFKAFNDRSPNKYATMASQGFLFLVVVAPLQIAFSSVDPVIGLFVVNIARIFVWTLAGLTLWTAAANSTRPIFFEFASVVIPVASILHFVKNTIPSLMEDTIFYLALFGTYLYNIGDYIFIVAVFFLAFWVKYGNNPANEIYC
ncbi:hypothetical protein EU537_05160 [Candidatus Thorarchaeota archaeon]|nr:MAG: hypothetical protein EU537_05160 [Candidatus Thorarchaeota archaeon]